MSFIGTLEQITLSTILQKIEGDAKNGILIIRQEPQWVELSFRQGQLMCIGPIRSSKTLGDRLLQAGVISQKALQEVATIPGASLQNETRTVIALIDLGYLNQDNLYIWAAQEASKVLQVLFSWTTGEIYFEEGVQPPSDRLLIALSVSSLIPLQATSTPSQPVSANIYASNVQKQPNLLATAATIPDAATLYGPLQFYDNSARSSTSRSLDFNEGYNADSMRNTDGLSSSSAPSTVLKRLTEPLTPRRIDTSFMQPQMVLNPTDLSGLRERNLHVQFSPEQWGLFTQVDGKTTLQMACQQLVMSRELVCQVAGELVALGLVTVSSPESGSPNDLAPFPLDLTKIELSSNSLMQAQGKSDLFSSAPVETQSQRGNGETHATFSNGKDWVVDASRPQPLHSRELSNSSNNEYAEASGIH